ncbi:glycoside hydrolase family 78 protein [Daedalea quercina L-15889]|uniref:Glycoside hydrolase family 78 protein n=1 Tax=Daedalea quercina L-15889 TaxID=1314783 RepID=A0A165M101_9APHY|nr:glycoside hydrolase family 78 protein [Daedalea quercina L-15889]
MLQDGSPEMAILLCSLGLLFGALCASGTTLSGPWDAFNLAPESKTTYAHTAYIVTGTVEDADNLANNTGSATLVGNGSFVTLDFGYEVGGIVSLTVDNATSSSSLALSFTESSLYISPLTSDDSAVQDANMSYDGVLPIPAPLETGLWTAPDYRLRGGFRFLTVVSTSDDPVTISNVSCAISFMPHWEDLRNYTGYFYTSDPESDDEAFLTRVWYSGAYTVQTATIAADTGRADPPLGSPGWYNNATAGIASPVIIDGAKRGRAIWLGDMDIAVPTQFVSTYDLLPGKNSIATIFSLMTEEGELPYSGPPLNEQGSDTYSAWTLIGTYNYYLYSGDLQFIQGLWGNYTKAVEYLAAKVDDTGLLYVTGTGDWGRLWMGGYNSEANAIYYQALLSSAKLAAWLNYTELADAYYINATRLKAEFNEAFWDDEVGMYRDNKTSTLYPQDGNAVAALFNLTTSAEQASRISDGLTQYWNEYGAVSPELPDNIAPFIAGFEVSAHFVSGNDERALDLIRLEWGYMLTTNISVHSTFLEGYTSNGSLYYRSYDGYAYDPTFTSHSHGWSTGPTSALTFYVLGLTVTSPLGQTWSIAPHTSGLPSAQGGYSTSLGWFGVDWTSAADGFNITISTPEGTGGTVKLPINGTVYVDGAVVDEDGSQPFELSGGNHTIAVES